jgi:hypothetical protein
LISLFFVFCTLAVVSLLTAFLTHRYKSRLTGMPGMIISMVFGMNSGLTAGIFLGTLYQGNLLYSTLFSVIIGALSGTACGFKLGILPSIEGFMSGVMGGMMGAMLGAMVSPYQSLVLINIFLTLSISSLLLYKILPRPITSADYETVLSSLIQPFFTFIFIFMYLLYGNQLGQAWVKNSNPPQNEIEIQQHDQHGH